MDTIDNRHRVLFVEDVDSMRESYLANIRRQNYRADGAANLAAAIDAIDKCTYHVAIVDIMLAGPRDTSNRDGLEVLRHIRSLDEGTQTIVLSGQENDLQLVSDSYAEHKVFSYILKNKVREEGVSFLLQAIQNAVANYPTKSTWNDLVNQIAWPIGEALFVSECLRLLEFNGGAGNLLNSLLTSCNPLMPLLVPKQSERALPYDKELDLFRGIFWSKGQGKAVEILVSGKNVSNALEKALTGRIILDKREKAGLSICIAEALESSRSEFSDRPQ